jgi:hypothetical protein
MATHQLMVIARAPRRPVAGSGPYESAIYDLTIEVNAAISRCVAAAAWLKPKFSAGCVVLVQFRPYQGDELLIEKPRSKNHGGVKEIICTVGVPVGWFAAGGHGVPAIRILRAVLQTLALVGKNFGIGVPPFRSRAAGGESAPADPFQTAAAGPSPYAEAGAELDRMARAAEPEQLILAAVDRAGKRRADIVKALGTAEAETILAGPGKVEVRVWTIRRHR